MSERVDLLYADYAHFADGPLRAVRVQAFGIDFGQNSWTTSDEYGGFLKALNVSSGSCVLDVASGSGGPALFAAQRFGCRVVGIDLHADAVATASIAAATANLADRVQFQVADASARLPFPDSEFDALICLDSINHFADRRHVFGEWHRVLRREARAVFVDPVVLTGPVTNDEIAARTAIGLFVFVPADVTERWASESGLEIIDRQDVTAAGGAVAARWRDARQGSRDALIAIEGEERFEGLQRFFDFFLGGFTLRTGAALEQQQD